MIQFKKLTADAFDTVSPIFMQSGIENWEHNFATVLVWSHKYNIEYAVIDETVFMFSENDGIGWYIYPCGKMSMKNAVNLILQDAKDRGLKRKIYGIDEEKLQLLQCEFSDIFAIEEDRDDEDYVYLSQDLINLQGKNYQKKRNHISRFKRDYPDYKYIRIDENNIDRIKDFENTWSELYNTDEDENLLKEQEGIRELLDNFTKLKLMGSAIEIDGKIVAISIASKTSDRMVDVIVEKAYHDVNGAYAVINQEFASDCFKNFEFINREDDMGIENLRQAKLRYFPYEIKKKYTALVKE